MFALNSKLVPLSIDHNGSILWHTDSLLAGSQTTGVRGDKPCTLVIGARGLATGLHWEYYGLIGKRAT
jgi:hypothetical protein